MRTKEKIRSKDKITLSLYEKSILRFAWINGISKTNAWINSVLISLANRNLIYFIPALDAFNLTEKGIIVGNICYIESLKQLVEENKNLSKITSAAILKNNDRTIEMLWNFYEQTISYDNLTEDRNTLLRSGVLNDYRK